MWDSKTFTEMECVKTNDQQWNRTMICPVLLMCALLDYSARPVLDTSGIRLLTSAYPSVLSLQQNLHWRRHWRRLHGYWLRSDLSDVLAVPLRTPRGAIHRVCGMFKIPFAIVDMRDISCVTTARRLQAGTINGSYTSFLTATDYFTQTSTNIAGAISISVSTAIEAFNLLRPPNVHVDVCHWVWRPTCLTPRCVPNRPVEFPSTRSHLVDCTGVAQWSSALESG